MGWDKMNKKLIMFLICMCIIPFVYAQPSFVIEQETAFDFKIPCTDADNNFCAISTNCTFTSTSPDGDIIINNQAMTFNTAFFNYTATAINNSQLGVYSANVQCVGTTSGFTTFTYAT